MRIHLDTILYFIIAPIILLLVAWTLIYIPFEKAWFHIKWKLGL